jgi:hypothetical protein
MSFPDDVIPRDDVDPDDRDPATSDAAAGDRPTVSDSIEAPEWDAQEQSRAVPFDDDYR